nr:amino acid ABC transporter permease [Lactobacillus pasteurii]
MMDFVNALSWVNFRFLLQGLWVTIYVSLISIALSFLIGLLLGTIRYTKTPIISKLVGFIVDVVRNLPLLLIIFFTYFGLPGIGVRVNSLVASIIALVIFESAMISEIVRSGINAVDEGQMEGARSNGMNFVQAMFYVVMPQALLKMIPTLLSQFVSLVKDTSLATIIILPELLYHAQIVYSQNTNYMIPMYLIIAAMYFVVCFCLSMFASYLQRKFDSR